MIFVVICPVVESIALVVVSSENMVIDMKSVMNVSAYAGELTIGHLRGS